jgi:hypothetical protein
MSSSSSQPKHFPRSPNAQNQSQSQQQPYYINNNNNNNNNDNNNAFAFDPALTGETQDHDASSMFGNGQEWNYQPEHISLNNGHDSQASLYPGWHNANQQQHHDLSIHTPVPFNDIYQQQYGHDQQQQSGNGTFDPSHDYRYQMQSSYGLPNPYDAVLTTGSYGTDNEGYPNPTPQVSTISPGALESRPQPYVNALPSSSLQPFSKRESSVHTKRESPAPASRRFRMPKGIEMGKFTTIAPETLSGLVRCRQLHSFLHVGDETVEVPITKTSIPAYVPRKSRNEIKKLLANDSGLTAKLAKKSRKGSLSTSQAPSRRSETPTTSRVAVKNAASQSSTEPESSSEDSDSEEEESMHPPIPAVRPVRALEAVKYDTVKTLWRVPYRSVEGDDIRKALGQFWDIVRTIRDRWKSDTTAVKQAEDEKKVHEVPLLKERVMNQRDMLEGALESAAKEGHRDIVEQYVDPEPPALTLTPLVGMLDLNLCFSCNVLYCSANGVYTLPVILIPGNCKAGIYTSRLVKRQCPQIILAQNCLSHSLKHEYILDNHLIIV